jgi:hypothetical protein
VADAPVRRRKKGGFDVQLDPDERELLATLAGDLRSQLVSGSPSSDPSLQRLFPPAYPDEMLMNLDFERTAGETVLTGRLAALDVLARTARADVVSDEELDAWMRSINDIRLVLGSRIGISDDEPPPGAESDPAVRSVWHTYGYLSLMLERLMETVADPDETTPR